jgi:hypothetical protein
MLSTLPTAYFTKETPLKSLLFLLSLSFPVLGSDMLVMSYSIHENVPYTATKKGFELPLSAQDAANEIPNHDTVVPKPTIRLLSIYRTGKEPSEESSDGGFFSLQGLSLYRSATPSEKSANPSPTAKLVERMQEKYRHIVAATVRSSSAMTEEILYAVMWVESRGKSSVVSSKGAQGVMQINAITQRELGLKPGEAFMPKKAIPKAAQYLETNYKAFGSWQSALLAYNIGPANARSYLRKGKDPKRHPYVKSVLRAQMLM